jgi:hypothetical protein
MSTRKSSKRKANQQLVSREHQLPRSQLVELYRQNSMRTIRDVRRGMVNELDVDKLQNFLQVSLALMELVSVSTFEQARMNAELLSFFKGGDTSVVLDPLKQKKQEFPPLDLDIGAIVEEAVLQMNDIEVHSLSQLVGDVKAAHEGRELAQAIPENQLDDTIALVKQLQEEEQ